MFLEICKKDPPSPQDSQRPSPAPGAPRPWAPAGSPISPPARSPPPTAPLLLQFEIRQLRAHLAQQDLDLAAEREAALQAPHVLSQPRSRYKVVEAGTWAEETAAESVVEELQPSQGEPARGPPRPAPPPPRALRADSRGLASLLAGLVGGGAHLGRGVPLGRPFLAREQAFRQAALP